MINSTQLETLYNTANNFYDNQKYDEAIQYYDKVLAINPSAVGALNSKGLALDHLQRYDEALQSFELDTSNPKALDGKASILSKVKQEG
jgi:tetratricopeptide (TPR) repeat protein